jgi:hypothetical protein
LSEQLTSHVHLLLSLVSKLITNHAIVVPNDDPSCVGIAFSMANANIAIVQTWSLEWFNPFCAFGCARCGGLACVLLVLALSKTWYEGNLDRVMKRGRMQVHWNKFRRSQNFFAKFFRRIII